MIRIKDVIPAFATHPGELIFDELKARNIKQRAFAESINMSYSLLNMLIKGKRNINAEIALMLEKALGIDANYWMRLQASYELDCVRIKQQKGTKK